MNYLVYHYYYQINFSRHEHFIFRDGQKNFVVFLKYALDFRDNQPILGGIPIKLFPYKLINGDGPPKIFTSKNIEVNFRDGPLKGSTSVNRPSKSSCSTQPDIELTEGNWRGRRPQSLMSLIPPQLPDHISTNQKHQAQFQSRRPNQQCGGYITT